jgi:hypothetical protein
MLVVLQTLKSDILVARRQTLESSHLITTAIQVKHLMDIKKTVEDLQKQKAATLASDAKTQKTKGGLNIGILKNNMHEHKKIP